MLIRLREIAATGVEPDDEFWDEFVAGFMHGERAVDMRRLGPAINDALTVDLTIDRREFLWTDGAEQINVPGGMGMTYLASAQLRNRVASLDHVTGDTLDQRISGGAAPNVPPHELVDLATEVLDTLRWSADQGLDALWCFSAT